FGGKRPDKDTYTITADTSLSTITAVRLEVLTDDSLPHKGPGRQDNGNLHLNEFILAAAAKGGKRPTAVAIASATADFNQAGWTIAHAIDGKPATAWGIYPAVGKPHQAVFIFKTPIRHAGGAPLTFTLQQTHGGGPLIGRLRLSATSSATPRTLRPLPDDIAQLLAIDPTKRTEAQRAELTRHVLLEKVAADDAALPRQRQVFAAAPDFKPE